MEGSTAPVILCLDDRTEVTAILEVAAGKSLHGFPPIF